MSSWCRSARSIVRSAIGAGLVLAGLVPGSAQSGGKKSDWFLIDGPFAGQRIVATEAEAPAPVLPTDNPVTGADGQITGTEPGCQPPPVGTHFHGSLFFVDDPEPSGCGWGRAVMHQPRTDGLRELSDAIQSEVDAVRILVLVSGDPGKLGRRDLAAASRALDAHK